MSDIIQIMPILVCNDDAIVLIDNTETGPKAMGITMKEKCRIMGKNNFILLINTDDDTTNKWQLAIFHLSANGIKSNILSTPDLIGAIIIDVLPCHILFIRKQDSKLILLEVTETGNYSIPTNYM